MSRSMQVLGICCVLFVLAVAGGAQAGTPDPSSPEALGAVAPAASETVGEAGAGACLQDLPNLGALTGPSPQPQSHCQGGTCNECCEFYFDNCIADCGGWGAPNFQCVRVCEEQLNECYAGCL